MPMLESYNRSELPCPLVPSCRLGKYFSLLALAHTISRLVLKNTDWFAGKISDEH